LPQLPQENVEDTGKDVSHVNIKTLILSNNDIFDSSILEDLKIGLSCSCLTELDLSNNNLGDLAPKYIG
jgi:hypothetical protein